MTFSRHTVRDTVIDMLRSSPVLAGVQVEPGWPGDQVEPESIWCDESTGELNIPLSRAEPEGMTYDDEFALPLLMQAGKGGQTLDEASARGAELWGAVLSTFAADPSLRDLHEVIDAVLGSYREVTVRTQEGAVWFARAELNVHTRVT